MAAQKRCLDCLGETVQQLAAKRICLTPHAPASHLGDTFSSAALPPTCSGSLEVRGLQPLLNLAYTHLKHLVDHQQSSTDWDHSAVDNYDTQVRALPYPTVTGQKRLAEQMDVAGAQSVGTYYDSHANPFWRKECSVDRALTAT